MDLGKRGGNVLLKAIGQIFSDCEAIWRVLKVKKRYLSRWISLTRPNFDLELMVSGLSGHTWNEIR